MRHQMEAERGERPGSHTNILHQQPGFLQAQPVEIYTHTRTRGIQYTLTLTHTHTHTYTHTHIHLHTHTHTLDTPDTG